MLEAGCWAGGWPGDALTTGDWTTECGTRRAPCERAVPPAPLRSRPEEGGCLSKSLGGRSPGCGYAGARQPVESESEMNASEI